MAAGGNTVSLPKRDFYGSRLRCLLLTHQPSSVVAERLTELVEPFAVVDAEQDAAGHDFGPGSAGLGAAVATVDGDLGRLLDGIAALPHADDVFVVLVSDHGMMSAPADHPGS